MAYVVTRHALMGLVMLTLFAGLAFCAWRTDDRTMRLIWGGFAIMNLACAFWMIHTGDARAFHLLPNDGSGDTGPFRG